MIWHSIGFVNKLLDEFVALCSSALITALCSLRSAHCALLIALCSLRSAQCALRIALCDVLTHFFLKRLAEDSWGQTFLETGLVNTLSFIASKSTVDSMDGSSSRHHQKDNLG
jgi:hypothetical protein